MIDVLHVIRYPRGQLPYETDEIERPTWEKVEHEIRTMHRHDKPLLFLLQNREWMESDQLSITGGEGLYHVTICDHEGGWSEAFDPEGSTEEVTLWTSDQGFQTEARYAWNESVVLEIARFYFDSQQTHPDYHWE